MRRLERIAGRDRSADARVKRVVALVADGDGAGRVAIFKIDPFEEGFAGQRGDRGAGHGQPLVPTARRYSVTWTLLVTPVSTASALRIAG